LDLLKAAEEEEEEEEEDDEEEEGEELEEVNIKCETKQNENHNTPQA
jgi:hypothetical protein